MDVTYVKDAAMIRQGINQGKKKAARSGFF